MECIGDEENQNRSSANDKSRSRRALILDLLNPQRVVEFCETLVSWSSGFGHGRSAHTSVVVRRKLVGDDAVQVGIDLGGR